MNIKDYLLGEQALSNNDTKLAIQYIVNSKVPWKEAKITELKELTYEQALNKATSENWNEAVDLLTELDYSDSEALLETYTRNKGMAENSDFQFLDSFQEAVKRRIEITESNSYNASDLVAAETSRLSKFRGGTFFDKELESLAMKYLDGLEKQEKALKKSYSEYQILWYEGLVERYRVIVTLTEKFDLFKDDPAFVAEHYTAELPECEEYLKALKAADVDFRIQFTSYPWKRDNGYQISIPYTNHTNYAFDKLWVYVFFYDANGMRVGDSSYYIENLKCEQKTICEFYASNARNVQSCQFYWEFEPHIE